MQTRLATPADHPALAQLFTDAVHGLAGTRYSAGQLEAWAPSQPDIGAWRERLTPVHTLIAEDTKGDEDARRMLGFLSWRDDGYIAFMFTSPAAARRGVATALYAQAEAALVSAGAQRCFTEASLISAPFFAAHGYQVDQEETVERRGVLLRRYLMSKVLATSPGRPPLQPPS